QMLRVSDTIRIDEAELEETFVRAAAGPGGQHVNKVASAVELRFDVRRSRSLPEPVRLRLERLAAGRLTKEGVIIIAANRFRSHPGKRADARERLLALIAKAAAPPPPRRPTKPPRQAKARREEEKRRRAGLKALRRTRLED